MFNNFTKKKKKINKRFIWNRKVSKSSLTYEHKIAKLIFAKSHMFETRNRKIFIIFSDNKNIQSR